MFGRTSTPTRGSTCLAAALLAVAVALVFGLIGATSVAAAASTITVTTTNDVAATDGQCSLREAITNANAIVDTTGGDCAVGTVGADTIDLSSLSGAIVLASDLPTIADDLTLSGPGSTSLTIDANGNNHVLSIGGVTVTISGLKLTGGAGAFSGGGIDNEFGNLTIQNIVITGNSAQFGGGGIYNYGGSLTVEKSTIANNNTSSFGSGGGIFTSNGGTMMVDRSTISGNSAAFGGGIGLDGFSATILNSTIASNSGSGTGGGILDELGTLTVTSSTITANSAPNAGFGSAGGIQMAFGGASATLSNTIVAAQTAGANCNEPPGEITDGGYNLEDSTSCGFSTTNHSQPATNPTLDPDGLKDNGGPTNTIAVLAGSPAINTIPAGTNGCGTTLTVDQRDVARPQGASCEKVPSSSSWQP